MPKLILCFRQIMFLVLLVCFSKFTTAQDAAPYQDYLGLGHNNGTTISTSSNETNTIGNNTVNGQGLMPSLGAGSRFLAQASFGGNVEAIEEIENIGFTEWIEHQQSLAPSYISPIYNNIVDTMQAFGYANGAPTDFYQPLYFYHFRMAWWQNAMTAPDVLRQRVALALSEIFVISDNSDLADFPEALTDYYDMLITHSFGNYRDLLYDVTMHPAMGFYLSHLNNPRAIPTENVFPDENYAREIMQLFSIGLFELNEDGTKKLDEQGNPIPTYTNEQITEMAKVFTGLGGGAYWGDDNPDNVDFFSGIYELDMTEPMQMFPFWHQPGAKHLLNDFLIPAGQTGMQDINMALDHLFNHPNVGPFIGYRLIQRLVKSNPSPEYVARITQVFNNNGQGERGDLGAVVRAILLDPEARSCQIAMQDPSTGMLREPIMRYLHYINAFDLQASEQGTYYFPAFNFERNLEQHPMSAPTVFNFFRPNYTPLGAISDADLVAPEFQITNSQSIIRYTNYAFSWTVFDVIMDDWNNYYYDEEFTEVEMYSNDESLLTDLSDEMAMTANPTALVDRLDLILTHGMMDSDFKQSITASIEAIPMVYAEYRLRLALFLIMMSPEYVVLK